MLLGKIFYWTAQKEVQFKCNFAMISIDQGEFRFQNFQKLCNLRNLYDKRIHMLRCQSWNYNHIQDHIVFLKWKGNSVNSINLLYH